MTGEFIERIIPYCAALLILVGVSVGFAVFTKSVPNSIIVINPVGEMIPVVAAVATGVLCFPGIICLFWKEIRLYVGLALGVVLLLFFAACCLDAAWERMNYTMVKNNVPVRRMAVIEPAEDSDAFSFRFLDGNQEKGGIDIETLMYMGAIEEGDTCLTYFVEGKFNIDFVVDMRVKRRGKR